MLNSVYFNQDLSYYNIGKKAENVLFYDMDRDEMLQKALDKLRRKEVMVRDAENRMIKKDKAVLE